MEREKNDRSSSPHQRMGGELTRDELDETGELTPNEELFERVVPGEQPLWLWAQTCPEDECPCRSALLVAASSREQVLEHAATARDLWLNEATAETFAAKLPEEIVAFEIDIDSGDVSMPMSDDTIISESVARAAQRIDGDLLDALNSLWFQGKEQEDLSSIPIEPREIRSYKPGQLLAWDEVYTGARADFYTMDDASVEAIETFCVRADCQCNDVHIQFYLLPTEDEDDTSDEDEDEDADSEDEEAQSDDHGNLGDHVYLGMVSVILEDPIRIQLNPDEGQADRLGAVFARYQARYPQLGPRLAQRADKMAAFGQKLRAHLNRKGSRSWVSSSRKRRNKER